MSIKQIDGYKIKMNECLGKGSYGSVYVGESDATHKKVAIKVIPKDAIDSDEYLKGALFQQIKIMQSVKNPNIVRFVDVMESSKNYYIIQQLCDGDITCLMKPGKQLSEKQSINMLTQIVNGFLVLVRQGIMHRDLKPANIMIKDGVLKIGDFGFAKKIPNNNFKNKTVVGTPLYMSIQILKTQPYTTKCDIWALGFIFYELLHGTTPWIAKSEYQLIKNITNIPLTIKRKDLKSQTTDFIKKCLGVRQQERISWDQVFLHPIFSGFFDSKGQNKKFENKLKQIMNDLRFYIKSNNLDLSKILYGLGYNSEQQQLDFEQYYYFLRTVNPEITKDQSLYVFKETDKDNSNSISILQIEQILNQHSISFTSTFRGVPKFANKQVEAQTFVKISEATQQKIHNCFTKLFKIIVRNKMSLQKVFTDFDKQKDGRLGEKQFVYMMSKLDKTMQQDQLAQAFNLIDQDGSKTIQFDELNKYYCKVNGIPMGKTSANEHMDIEQNNLKGSSKSYNSKTENPLFKLQHQHSLPYYPTQQPMMYYQQPQNNYIPQQPQGMFGNFIMNQISQNIHGSNGSNKNLPGYPQW